MLSILLTLLIGLCLLLISTHHFVKQAESISHKLGISPLIIGTTIVAIGTSLPELIVSTISVVRHDTNLAFSNIIGSNIINVLLVLPIGILVHQPRIGTNKTQKHSIILIFSTLLFFLVSTIPSLPPVFKATPLAISILVSLFNQNEVKNNLAKKNKNLNFFFFLGLLTTIVVSGFLIVDSIEKFSQITNISTTILGLTLTAIATSLPELLTTIFSQGDKQDKLTIGNLIGSNIYNLLLIGGIITLFSPKVYTPTSTWLWLSVSTITFGILISKYKGMKIPKYFSFILLSLFFLYIIDQIK